MRRLRYITAAAIIIAFMAQSVTGYADLGDMGFFGGITEGRRLPKTTEIILESAIYADRRAVTVFNYAETIFLSGRPVVFNGSLRVNYSGDFENNGENAGSYTVSYRVSANSSTDEGVELSRFITFDVNWRIEGSQIIRDYTARQNTWAESIRPGRQRGMSSLGDNLTYTLDRSQSSYNISIIEDCTPAVSYYRGDVSQRSVYINTANMQTVNEVYGSFYGYDCAWSSSEVHRLDGAVYRKERSGPGREYQDIWQMQYQVRPAVSVKKTLQYTENEPTLISFDGNYKEVLSNDSGLFYDLFVKPNELFDEPDSGGTSTLIPGETSESSVGGVSIPSVNVFEQLIAPNLSHLKSHPAHSDIEKLFAMQILEGNPQFYVPSQAITRAQFTAMVVNALKLPMHELRLDDSIPRRVRNRTPVVLLFPDVPADHPYFDHITTAYRSGIVVGRTGGMFSADAPVEREEAFVIMLRALGLENLGLTPTPVTLFTDDALISDWARKELYAAERIGLIAPDDDGRIRPKQQITKAEAAALINLLIEYMRHDLVRDYTEHIVNVVY